MSDTYTTAKRRRNATTVAVMELADLLPLPPETDTSKLKTNHVLRLAVSYINLKHMMNGKKRRTSPLSLPCIQSHDGDSGSDCGAAISSSSSGIGGGSDSRVASRVSGSFRPDSQGVLKALDGFLMVVGVKDLDLLYVSESIRDHLGLYMVDYVGHPLRNLVMPEDMAGVKQNLECEPAGDLFAQRTFFCKMRSARGKRPNGRTKSPGQKLVHVTGKMHQFQLDSSKNADLLDNLTFVGTVRVVKPVSIVEPKFSCVLFTSRTTLDLQILKIDSSVAPELSGRGQAISGMKCQKYWHSDDLTWIMESFDRLLKFGETMWIVHRIMYKGQWTWIQAHSTIVKNKYIENSVSIVSEEVGQRSLSVRGSRPDVAQQKSTKTSDLTDERQGPLATALPSIRTFSLSSPLASPTQSIATFMTLPESVIDERKENKIDAIGSSAVSMPVASSSTPSPPAYEWFHSPEFDQVIDDLLSKPDSLFDLPDFPVDLPSIFPDTTQDGSSVNDLQDNFFEN